MSLLCKRIGRRRYYKAGIAAVLLLSCAGLVMNFVTTWQMTPPALVIMQQQLIQNSSNFSDIGQHFFKAYHDWRPSLGGEKFVRIVAVLDNKAFSDGFHCELFDYRGDRVFNSSAKKSMIGSGMPHKQSYYQEFVLSCRSVAAAAFVVVRSQDARHGSGAIPILHNPQSAASSAAVRPIVNCVSVTFGDPSEHRLIEWLEAQRLLGMSKVQLHFYHVTNKKFVEMAEAYEREGFVDVRRIDCPFCEDGSESRLALLLMSPAINQCLYENLGRYNYTAVFDLDEIIVPQQHSNYQQMLANLSSQHSSSSFAFPNWYHFFELGQLPNVSQRLQMLRHPFCLANASPVGYSTKSIHYSQHVVALHNHFSWENIPNAGTKHNSLPVPASIGINQHFKTCHFDADRCQRLTNPRKRIENLRLNRLLGGRLAAAAAGRRRRLSLQ